MKEKNKQIKLNKLPACNSRALQIFNSFKEQEDYELQEMAKLTGEQILMQMRQMINIAYGMHGYDPLNLPLKHDIVILQLDTQ